jgi:hypothetical protein
VRAMTVHPLHIGQPRTVYRRTTTPWPNRRSLTNSSFRHDPGSSARKGRCRLTQGCLPARIRS